MTDFRETKIKILSEEHSRAFQEAVFAAGGGWHSKTAVKFPFAKFLFVDADLTLTFEDSDRDYFDGHKYTEIQFSVPTTGHPHVKLMLQYAQDAMTTSEPWKLWQVQDGDFGGPKGEWRNLEEYSNLWIIGKNYRRKPITKLIHGVEVPDISFQPNPHDEYFHPDPTMYNMYCHTYFFEVSPADHFRSKHNLCYPNTEEGREAAILHAKAMLGIK